MTNLSKSRTNKLATVILARLSKMFDNLVIEKVNVAPDVDRDGDDILRIEVVFVGPMGDSDAKKVAAAVRELRPSLGGLVDDLYPLLSFVSKVDYDREHKRAAR